MYVVCSLASSAISACKGRKRVDGTSTYPWVIYPLFIPQDAHAPERQTIAFHTA
jgi:hypothetical protein